MKTLTKALNNHKIPYKWHHPATVIVTKNGATHTVTNIDNGLLLLQSCGIIHDLPNTMMQHNVKPQKPGFQQKGLRIPRGK